MMLKSLASLKRLHRSLTDHLAFIFVELSSSSSELSELEELSSSSSELEELEELSSSSIGVKVN